jgi:hypothetical protein
MVMENMLTYLVIAIVVGGAVPIVLSYITKRQKPPTGPDDDHKE